MEFGHFCLPTYFPDRDGTPGEYLRRFTDLLVWSEELGFDALWANEHHFHPFGGVIPSPPILLATLAQRTKRVRLGTSIIVLPLHNPLEIAEQLAMVDLLSNGRVELGVGRGLIIYDYEVFGIPVSESLERTLEGFQVIQKAWSNQRFTHHGTYYHYDDVEMWPRPEQRPHPPLIVACSGTPESFVRTGREGHRLLTVAYIKQLESLGALVRQYCQAWDEAGHDPAARRIRTHYQIVVGENRAEARRTMEDALRLYTAKINSARSLSRNADAQKKQNTVVEEIVIDRLVEEGRVIAGTPEDCVATLKMAQEKIGFTGVDGTFYFGGISYERARESLELFAREVMPKLREGATELALAPVP